MKKYFVIAIAIVTGFLGMSQVSLAQDEPAAASAAASSAEPAAPVAEAKPEAKLLRLVGAAEVKGPADTMFYPATAGSMLPMSGTFRVLPGGKAQIELPNGGIVLLKEFTVVRLDELSKEKDAAISIPIGEFLIGFKAPLGEGKKFQVKTPAAVAGIRGTLFWGLADADMTSTFACFHGTITLDAAGKTVELKPGVLSSTKIGEAPAEPTAHNVPAEYLETFAVEGSLEGLPELLKEK